jgi:hypothetical protein
MALDEAGQFRAVFFVFDMATHQHNDLTTYDYGSDYHVAFSLAQCLNMEKLGTGHGCTRYNESTCCTIRWRWHMYDTVTLALQVNTPSGRAL